MKCILCKKEVEDSFFYFETDSGEKKCICESCEAIMLNTERIENNMSTYVHRCLDCNAISYEVEKDKYKCGTCGFEWEVLDCGF